MSLYNLSGYKRIILTALEGGYRLTNFERFAIDRHQPADGPLLILRYDVDHSPGMAWKVAKANSELGVYGTFFIRLRSTTYNPFSRENREYIRKIYESGQIIAYHGDITKADAADASFVDRTLEEIEVLSKGVGVPVAKVVSWHDCPDELRDIADLLVGTRLLCTYQKEFYKDMAFLSDVDMKRGESDFMIDLQDKPKHGIQMQFNPTNWVAVGMDMPTMLLQLMKKLILDLERPFQDIQTWKRDLSRDFQIEFQQMIERLENKINKG